jgi:hypothetical protein
VKLTAASQRERRVRLLGRRGESPVDEPDDRDEQADADADRLLNR